MTSFMVKAPTHGMMVLITRALSSIIKEMASENNHKVMAFTGATIKTMNAVELE